MPDPLAPYRPHALVRRAPSPRSDHAALHRTVMASVVGASGGALVADLVCRLVGASAESSKMFVVLAAAGAFGAIAARGRRWLAGGIGLGLGAVGSLAAVLTAQWAPFSAVLFGAAAAPVLGEGERRGRKLLTGLVAGAFGYAGLHVAEVVLQSGVLLTLLPGPLAAAAAGATAGLFVGLAAAPRHLMKDPDPVELRYLEAMSLRDGELHALLERALDSHRAVRSELPAQQALEPRFSEQVLRILRIAEHCRQVDGELSRESITQLEDRIAQLERKAASTMDPSARDTYESALESLMAQRDVLEQLRSGRERVVARLHVHVALLEKLRLSVLQLRSADAERLGADGSVDDALEELGRELDLTADAISEVFGRGAARPALDRPRS